jgi:hypothetical protein
MKLYFNHEKLAITIEFVAWSDPLMRIIKNLPEDT